MKHILHIRRFYRSESSFLDVSKARPEVYSREYIHIRVDDLRDEPIYHPSDSDVVPLPTWTSKLKRKISFEIKYRRFPCNGNSLLARARTGKFGG